jgi:Mn-dependent DtxR family transcriptional regulator
MSTPSQEDYLEAIWQLIQEKGYARATDIAERLGISRASVSRMIRKLHQSGQLTYERYRGLNLTDSGRSRGQRLFERHQVLATFLEIIGFDDRRQVLATVEGIEHFFGPDELRRIERFVAFMQEQPEMREAWKRWQTDHPHQEECR